MSHEDFKEWARGVEIPDMSDYGLTVRRQMIEGQYGVIIENAETSAQVGYFNPMSLKVLGDQKYTKEYLINLAINGAAERIGDGNVKKLPKKMFEKDPHSMGQRVIEACRESALKEISGLDLAEAQKFVAKFDEQVEHVTKVTAEIMKEQGEKALLIDHIKNAGKEE